MHCAVLDLFAGAGGFTLGFEISNDDGDVYWHPVAAVDNDPTAARTYQRNFGVVVHGVDIEALDVSVLGRADVVLASPPCQGFSPLGIQREPSERDALNSLWEHCLTVIRAQRPIAFAIENVPEFHRSPQFCEFLRHMGNDPILSRYGFAFGTLDAADYGTAQHRRRGVFVAVRGQRVAWPPPPTHHEGALFGRCHTTVREAISDLSPIPGSDSPMVTDEGTQDLHVQRPINGVALERYKAIPPGGNRFDLQRNRPDIAYDCWLRKPAGSTDVMGRMWWDRPAPTIRTDCRPEKGRYLHPELDRPITLREAARLQGFPDSFVFDGAPSAIARQIGNAIPPPMAKAIALHIGAHTQVRASVMG